MQKYGILTGMNTLTIQNLTVQVEDKTVIHNFSCSIAHGQLCALLGQNGSGKSSLAATLAGHPRYEITQGAILFNDTDITSMRPDERAQAGIFLAFQYPFEIPGVELFTFLEESYRAVHGTANNFQEDLDHAMNLLDLDYAYLLRGLNEGFSGGEKKKIELLQMLLLKPKLAMLDEIDSGLDVDALKLVARALEKVRTDNPSMSMLIITHYQQILQFLTPDRVLIMHEGRLADTGDASLAHTTHTQGYQSYADRS